MPVSPDDVSMNVGAYTFSHNGLDIVKMDKVVRAGATSFRIYLTDVVVEQLRNYNIGVSNTEWSMPTEDTASSLAKTKAATIATELTNLHKSRQNLSKL